MNKDKIGPKKSGFGTCSLILGIVGISLSFIPILNNASFFLGVLAIVFGIISLVKKEARERLLLH